MAVQHRIGLSADVVAQLALLSAAALWGAGFFVTKIGVQFADPFAFIALRFGAAALFLGIVLRRSLARVTQREIVSGLIVAVAGALGYASIAYALQSEPSARVAFLSALYVPLVPVLQWMIFRRNPVASVWVGVSLALFGVAVMAGIASSTTDVSVGDALALVSAAFGALQVVVLGIYSQGAKAFHLAWTTLVWTAIICAVMAVLAGEAVPSATPLLFWIVVGFGTATAYIQFAMSWGQARVEASKAALIYATEPVFGGLIGWMAGETWGVGDIVGGMLIVMGVLIGAMPWRGGRLIAARSWLSFRFATARRIVAPEIELP